MKDGKEWAVPKEGKGSYTLNSQWDKASSNDPQNPLHTNLEFVVDPTFGSFAVEIPIPEGASYGSVEIYVQGLSSSTTVIVSDPRPPTVRMDMKALAKIVDPGAGAFFPLHFQTETYTGLPVGNADIELDWTVTRADRNLRTGGTEGCAGIFGVDLVTSDFLEGTGRYANFYVRDAPAMSVKGQTTVTTDETGEAQFDLTIGDILASLGEEECGEGDVVAVTATWIGPTSEIVRQSVELTVERSEWKLRLKITSASPEALASEWQVLPGKEFGVYADVVDLDGRSVLGETVTMTLHPWDGETSLGAAASKDTGSTPRTTNEPRDLVAGNGAIATCTLTSNGGRRPQCSLTLPRVGKFLLFARVVDAAGREVLTVLPLGRSEEEWTKTPLRTVENVPMSLDADSYRSDGSVSLSFYNPFEGAQLLLRWGNEFGWNHRQFDITTTGLQQVSFSLDDGTSCIGGCLLMTILTAPNQLASHVTPIQVPVSPLYFLESPRAITQTIAVSVPDVERSLHVDVAVDDAALEPGGSTSIRIQVSDPDGGDYSSDDGDDVEVCVMVVDRSILDLTPSPLPLLDTAFAKQSRHVGHSAANAANLASYTNYQTTLNTFLRRLAYDPFAVPTDWPLQPPAQYWWSGQSVSEIEMTDEQYWERHYDTLSWYPYRGFDGGDVYYQGGGGGGGRGGNEYVDRGGVFMNDGAMEKNAMADVAGGSAAPGMGVPEMGGGSSIATAQDREGVATTTPTSSGVGGGGGGERSPGVAYLRTQFETTPLFAKSVRVDPTGKANVRLDLPDNIGTFSVRVFAVSAKHQFGQQEKDIVSNRAISLMPSLPRLVRTYDHFEAGVTLTAESSTYDDTLVVSVDIVNDADVAKDDRTKRLVHLLEGSEREAHITGVGPHEIRFKFAASASVLGTAHIRFAVKTMDGVLLDSLEAELPVLGQQDPVHVATSMAVVADPNGSAWPEGLVLPKAVEGSGSMDIFLGIGRLPRVRQMSSALLRALQTAYTPSGIDFAACLMPAAAAVAYNLEDEFALTASETFASSLKMLEKYTHDYYGLLYSPTYSYHGSYPEFWMNANGAMVATRVEALSRGKLKVPLATKWKNAAEEAVTKQATEYRQNPQYNTKFDDMDMLVTTFFIFGFGWTPNVPSWQYQRGLIMQVFALSFILTRSIYFKKVII